MEICLEDVLDIACIEWHEVGSRVTCNPPELLTDRDVLCLVDCREGFVDSATKLGFAQAEYMPSSEHPTLFTSVRLGDDNLIITDNREFASRFMVATRLAKRLNLRQKEDRVALFQAVLYGKGCRDETTL